MPEANQYLFSNKELLELLVKKADVHEGRWMLMTNFNITAGNFGPAVDQTAPGVAVVIGQIGIQKAPENAPEGTWVDASVVNPKVAKRS